VIGQQEDTLDLRLDRGELKYLAYILTVPE
jgi:hypothetical protein